MVEDRGAYMWGLIEEALAELKRARTRGERREAREYLRRMRAQYIANQYPLDGGRFEAMYAESALGKKVSRGRQS